MVQKNVASLLVLLLLAPSFLYLSCRKTDRDDLASFLAVRNDGRNTKSSKVFTTQGDFTDLAGFWLGELVGTLRLLYRVQPNGEVSLYSLDQGGGIIAASTTIYDATTGELVLVFPLVNGVYKGRISNDALRGSEASTDAAAGNMMVGVWNQGRDLPLEMKRHVGKDLLPREYRFLLRKTVTGTPGMLMNMVGYWSGNVIDDDDIPPQLVIIHIEKTGDSFVEPTLLLPDESCLPYPLRSFQVDDDGNVKIVGDLAMKDINAIFEGNISSSSSGGREMTGNVFYDDQAATPPLTLAWSDQNPYTNGVNAIGSSADHF